MELRGEGKEKQNVNNNMEILHICAGRGHKTA
jgi:hypothetical protein